MNALLRLPFALSLSLLLGACCMAQPLPVEAEARSECVILLHGLARTRCSLQKMAETLRAEGYSVLNPGYPSLEKPLPALAEAIFPPALAQCREHQARRIHFVTHSMGGILVRYYLARERAALPELGRVVMLSPPNQGSEVIDNFTGVPGFTLFTGEAGLTLGTAEDSIPNRLGPVDYPVGVITGDRSINVILSLLIPGRDDGKVSIERAKVEGMADFLVAPHSHPFIMRSDEVIAQTLYFLKHGRFEELTLRTPGSPD